ncbi:tetratricopeptide repeat protein [bacterium]|nr:tetratricopeptide repeat protein [candidate division CSSED10-310 bacterium]
MVFTPIPQELRELLEQARHLHSDGRTQDALNLLESADPSLQLSRLWALVSHYHFCLQQYDAAEIAARKALEGDPTNRLALQTYGELMVKRSNLDQAETFFLEAIVAGSTSHHVYLRLASIYITRLQYDRAIDILRQGLEKHTGHDILMERLQYALTMDSRIEEAKKIRESRIQSVSDTPDIRGLLNRFEGLDRHHAIKQLKLLASMEHYRKEASLHDQLARYLMDIGRYSEAVPFLETVIKLQNRNENARLNLAQCLVRTGDVTGAWAILEPMSRYRQDLPFQIILIEALIAANRLQEALDLCMRLLLSNPRDKRLRRLLQDLKRQGIRPLKNKPEPEP